MSPEDQAAWEEMWERKDDGREMFAQAELVQDYTMVIHHTDHRRGKPTEYKMKAGDKVLITMASRFGDVGIRGRDIDVEEHGYHGRVMPDELRNVKFLSDGGTPWRKEMMQKWGEWDKPEEPEEPDSDPSLYQTIEECSGSTQLPCVPRSRPRPVASSKKSRKKSKSSSSA